MIQLFFDGKEYPKERKIETLENISKILFKKREELEKLNLEDMIGIINNFGKNILLNKETREIEGIAFLSQWTRKANIEEMIEMNFGNKKILVDYLEMGGKQIIAQPKGVVGHWIAGNVVILGIFSLIQSLLTKNVNIIRIPTKSVPVIINLLKVLGKSECNGIKGSKLLSSTAVIYYPKENKEANEEFSMLCDARIVFGGKEAIDAISNTRKKETCEDTIFGPKYSFAVIDKETIEDEFFLKKSMERLVYDISFAEQNSCTSPQVLICEIEYSELNRIALEIKNAFENLPSKYHKKEISMFEASNIIRIRSEYAFEEGKKVVVSEGNGWTILLDGELKLEEPIKSRTIFVKSCKDVKEIKNLITPKVQTVGYAFKNKGKLIKLSRELNLRGVSRIVPLGQMNYYDSPWDGKLLLSRLVNFNSLKLSTEIK